MNYLDSYMQEREPPLRPPGSHKPLPDPSPPLPPPPSTARAHVASLMAVWR